MIIFLILLYFQNDFGQIYLDHAKEFIGTEYKGGTLDISQDEMCVLNLDGMDCVTFFENSLAFTRSSQHKNNFDTFLIKNEIINTRYRNNKVDGYLSRLHYSSEWILENTKDGSLIDVTKDLGGIKFSPQLNFMSKNNHLYKYLNDIDKMKKIEENINSNEFYFIPKENVKKIEGQLNSGDIVFIKTNVKGLDYSHVGIIDKSDGSARLLHASSKNGKVLIDTTISEYLKPHKTQTGITILRPIK